MYLNEGNLLTGEQYEKPEINWGEEDKYAIIAFLLLSIDKEIDHDGMVRFDDLFGLNDMPPKTEEEEEDEDFDVKSKRETRDTIVKECKAFLENLSADERYDMIVEEIDRFIQGDDTHAKCNIGGTYGTFGGIDKLDGGTHRIWQILPLIIFDDDYNGNKRRLLKHLARKWDVDISIFPTLERLAKLLPEITKKRKELSESDLPYREVMTKLARLDAEEKDVWTQLKSHGIAETLEVSESFARQFRYINSLRAQCGEAPITDINEMEAMADEENAEEYGIGDKIGDVIVSGIMKVTDIICAPIEWLTNKMM